MSEDRHLTAFLLVGLLGIVGAGMAVLGVSQSPDNVSLKQAVHNTLSAPNYTAVLTEKTAQGTQVQHWVYQSPGRLGGYVETAGKSGRTYFFFIGKSEYQSLSTTAASASGIRALVKQASAGAAQYDPVQGYVGYARNPKGVTGSGGTYTFSVTKQGQVGHFTVTVTGRYVSEVSLTVPGASLDLQISDVGTSPPVRLPAGAKITAASS